MQRVEAVRGGGVDDGLPLDAGAGADAAAHGVDLDALQAAGADQDRVAHVAERAGVVAGGLGGDAQAGGAGGAHDGGDLVASAGWATAAGRRSSPRLKPERPAS